MKLSKYIATGCIAMMGFFGTSCVGDLDVEPNDPNTKLGLDTQAEWDGYLARLYWNFLDDTGDLVSTSDGGAGSFTRSHFNLQEVVADEFFISEKWNDPGYNTLNFNTWANNNEWVYAAFSREFFMAKMCAEYIRDITSAQPEFYTAEEISARVAEAHVIRCYAYWCMIDLFGRGPWIDENSVTGDIPPTYDRTQLFEAVVAELKAAIPGVKWAAQQDYGRVSREAAYMLLAKLYLNAGVYTGTPMWAECAEACKMVMSTGIQLAEEYKYLFCASNDKYVGNGEILWAVPQLQGRFTTWGGTTYLTCGAWIESAPANVLNSLNSGDTPWSGLRIRPELSKALKGDKRRLIYEGTYQEEIPDLAAFDKNSCGYMLIKYTNTTEDDYDNSKFLAANPGANLNNGTAMSNTDYPLFRLADTYLMLAECQLNGVQCDGLARLNDVRARAGMEPVAALSEEVILKERMCELYGEGTRRSDLIRFGKYTGDQYVWSWKGGVLEGAYIDSYRALFAIPYQYIETVGQNPGY